MSEIPFVKALGDEIERAIAARRGRIRRRIAIGGLGFAIAASGAAAASGVFNDPQKLASTSIACYDRPSLDAGVSVVPAGEDAPVPACRRILKTDGPLVACAAESVAVFPGGRGTCARLGLRPLPREYATARQRFNALARDVTAIETAADCIPPRELADRVQALLDRTPGWEGWRVDVREDLLYGPCGAVTGLGGDGRRSLEGALISDTRTVIVTGTLPRSLANLLYAADGLAAQLADASGARCYDVAGLKELARRELAAAGRPVSFTIGELHPGAQIMDSRGDRLSEGCAVIDAVAAKDDDARELVVEILD